MDHRELDRRFPSFRYLGGIFADWDYTYSDPSEVMGSAFGDPDPADAEIIRDLEEVLRMSTIEPALRNAISSELNVHFSDDQQVVALLTAILEAVRRKPRWTGTL